MYHLWYGPLDCALSHLKSHINIVGAMCHPFHLYFTAMCPLFSLQEFVASEGEDDPEVEFLKSLTTKQKQKLLR